jgi:fatty acid synthase subunit alpha
MMKRTRDFVYRRYDIANSISREFLSLKQNRDDVYYVRQEKALKAAAAGAPKREAAISAPALAPSEAPAALPLVSHQQSLIPIPISATPVEDAPVQAKDIVVTIVSIALKKPAEGVAFDQSVKALSGGER